MMERARARSGAAEVDAEFGAVGMPADSMTMPFAPTDDEVLHDVAQRRLEALEVVLRTFPLARSPAAQENVAPAKEEEVTALTDLLNAVETCYAEIAAGRANQHIIDVFSWWRARQVRGTFKSAAATVRNVKKVLTTGNPPPGSKRLRILLDISGELRMKSAAALSAPWVMILPPALATPTMDPAVRAARIDTFLHECMHVLSSQIVDHTYWPDPNFASHPFATKIHNADHFAEVARRYRKTNTPLPGGGGDPFKGIKNANDRQLISGALGRARQQAKVAWIYSLDAWDALRKIRDDPNYYDHLSVSYQRPSLKRNMKLISEISNATMHERGPAPGAWLTSVTEFDLALLEETIVDLAVLVGWTRSRAEIQLVAEYPETPKAGVLYVKNEDLSKDLAKRASVDALANSFLEYSFSRHDQKGLWLQTNKLISSITSMVANQKAFRSLPDKPYKPKKA